MKFKFLILVSILASALMVVAGCSVYSPVDAQPVKNDTDTRVEISGCSSDPITLAAGQLGEMQISRMSKESCVVSNFNNDKHTCITLKGVSPPKLIYVSSAVTGSCSK